jgi:hypothetical protein
MKNIRKQRFKYRRNCQIVMASFIAQTFRGIGDFVREVNRDIANERYELYVETKRKPEGELRAHVDAYKKYGFPRLRRIIIGKNSTPERIRAYEEQLRTLEETGRSHSETQ